VRNAVIGDAASSQGSSSTTGSILIRKISMSVYVLWQPFYFYWKHFYRYFIECNNNTENLIPGSSSSLRKSNNMSPATISASQSIQSLSSGTIVNLSIKFINLKF